MSSLRDRIAVVETMLDAAERAAALVMRVYAEGFDVELKGEDDPVTRADKESNAFLCDVLARAYPGVPIVAEESDPSTFARYREARESFFVDPLDGTREFVAKNGQFCVLIGLAEEGRATAGVIVCPAIDLTVAGGEGVPAFRKLDGGGRAPVHVTGVSAIAEAEVVVSRFHAPVHVEAFARALGVRRVTPVGSSGVKGAYIACGRADAYVQAGPAGCLWDTCAPEAVIHAAGGRMTDARGERFDYRTAELRVRTGVLATNGQVHERMREALAKAVVPQG